MDTVSAAQRSEIMSRVRSVNTGPELAVRRLAHGLGYRFRLHRRDLPGRPDLVFPRRHKVIFFCMDASGTGTRAARWRGCQSLAWHSGVESLKATLGATAETSAPCAGLAGA